MADLSKIVLPIKNPKTGEPTKESFNIKGSGGGGGSVSWTIRGEEATFTSTPTNPNQ